MMLSTLWNPTHPDVAAALITALLLGLIHGLVPDEHTWPITFSYAVGSYSTRRGLRAGLLFSLTFTLQRAIACELAWLGLSHWMENQWLDRFLLIPIGLLMAWGGWLMQRKRQRGPDKEGVMSRLTAGMPAIHGFVAGWGFGAFALILYTSLAPAMPSIWWGWLPGALFGVGTAIVQGAAGALFGDMASRQKLSLDDMRTLALDTAARTLKWGGTAYIAAGAVSVVWPQLTEWQLSTGLTWTGFNHLDLPLIIAIVTVLLVGLGGFFSQLHKLTRNE